MSRITADASPAGTHLRTLKPLTCIKLYASISDMGKLRKLLSRLENPDADNAWTFDEAVYVLKALHFDCVGGKGSHQVFQNEKRQKTIVLAQHGGKIKSGYIRSLRKVVSNEE